MVADTFQGIHDAPYDPPPAPPPGPALLDDTESHMLESFFNTMGSSHLDSTDLLFNGLHHNGETSGGLGFDWVDDLPPVFEGSSTSLPMPTMPQGVDIVSDLFPGSESRPDMSTTSPEVLAAASMLYHNGHANGQPPPPLYPAQQFPDVLASASQSLSNKHSQGLSGTNGVTSRSGSIQKRAHFEEPPSLSSEVYFDGTQPPSHEQNARSKIGGLRWGSDASFVGQTFLAPPNQETEEEVTKTLLHHMECLEPQSSANNTRPASPVRRTDDVLQEVMDDGVRRNALEDEDKSAVDSARPTKRLKTKQQSEGSENEEKVPRRASKTKIGNKAPASSSTTISPPAKPRRSQGPDSKQPRENLSEDQKRSNHILSEQKRRNLIKQGFEDLCDLVPELQGGGFSKSAMLIQAADYLEVVLRGNEELRSQLADLKATESVGEYG